MHVAPRRLLLAATLALTASACGAGADEPRAPEPGSLDPTAILTRDDNLLLIVRPRALAGTRLDEVYEELRAKPQLARLASACPIDPKRDIHLIAIAIDAVLGSGTLFVAGDFGLEEIDECIHHLPGDVEGLLATRLGNRIELSYTEEVGFSDPIELYGRWYGGGLLLSDRRTGLDPARLGVVSPEMKEQLPYVRPGALFSIVGTEPGLERLELAERTGEVRLPRAAVANLEVDGGLRIDVAATMRSAQEAEDLARRVGSEIARIVDSPMVRHAVGDIDARTEASGRRVQFALRIGEKQMDKLVTLAMASASRSASRGPR